MNESEIFAQAAQAAEAKIPSIERKIEEFRSQMDALQTELNHLRMIANYGKKPKTAAKTAGIVVDDHPGIQAVVDALSARGPMTAKEIKDATVYGQSTIYSYLAQGKARGFFEQTKDDKWQMAG